MINFFSGNHIQEAVETQTLFDDRKVLPHLSKILQLVKNEEIKQAQLIQLSNIVKQSAVNVKINQNTNVKQRQERNQIINYPTVQTHEINIKQFEVKNFLEEAQKLSWAGYSLGNNVNLEIQKQLIILAQNQSLKQCRFWGKILGSYKDYYVVQALKPIPKTHFDIPLGSEKIGQGVNFYSFFVCNDIFQPVWVQLPYIKVQHIKVARKIKRNFTGDLNSHIFSYPIFQGTEAHYLKAQLIRLTSSLQLTPKGIYKPNDDNPKLIQYEEEVKIPEFSQLSTLQSWVHKNLMILNLGRCTHFIDPNLSQEQIQSVTAQLAEKDPQIQRLRVITEDKPPQAAEGQPPALQNYWIQKTVGNDQIFPKQDAQNIYAITTLKNVLWPGWITIGYKNGFTNFYLGNGLKGSQASWSFFTNDDLQTQQKQVQQFPQPNPKNLPPPVEENAQKKEGQQGQQE